MRCVQEFPVTDPFSVGKKPQSALRPMLQFPAIRTLTHMIRTLTEGWLPEKAKPISVAQHFLVLLQI